MAMKQILLGLALCLFLAQQACAAPHHSCHRLGDTITVRGKVAGSMNGGTYLELLEPVCANYPTAKNTQSASHLTTLGHRIPPGRYVEVTGVLKDSYARGEVGLDIEVVSFKDVDSEVNEARAGELASCKQWQEHAAPALSARAHGARVNPIEANADGLAPKCGIWAVDSQPPHENITVWRPGAHATAPRNAAQRRP